MRFHKLLIFLILLCPFTLQAAPLITVSGNSVTILGSAQTISLTCTLIDPNQTGNLRSGSNIITVFVTSTTTPGNVATCGPIYGNDVITDAFGNPNTTYYKVQVFTVSGGIVASTPSLQAFYAFTGSGTVDLSTATPLAPSFFTGPSGNVVMPGTLTVTGNTTLNANLTVSGTGTFTGSLNTKILESTNFYADQYCGGSLDVGLCINNTLAAMPTVSGYKYGTIRLDGMAPGSAWVWNTLVTISSPGVSILGPGSAALQITASTLTGDHLRVNTSPFTVTLAGQFGGFALVGGSQSNAVCVHLGDIIGAKITDLRCSNFTGTGAVGLWLDNVTNFTERFTIDKCHMDGNTKGIRLTNTGGASTNASFGHQRWNSIWLNVGANQTGISYESGTLYSGTFNITENLSATTSTAVAISGLQYSAGPAAAWTGSLVNINMETSAGSGTALNVGASNSFAVAGQVTIGGGLTNTCTGTCTFNLGNAVVNDDLSNLSVGIGQLFIGGAPGGSNLSQFLHNSSTVAGISGANYAVLNSGVAALQTFDNSGNLGLAGGLRSVASIAPSVAGAADAGTTTLPYGNLWLGTAATNNFKFAPAATAAARTITINDPLGNVNLPLTIASGTKALNTASITTATCDAGVAATATGTLSTDAVDWSFNAAPTATNKYGAFLVVYAVPSANTVTFYTCNPSATTSTPTAMTVNWSVRRP